MANSLTLADGLHSTPIGIFGTVAYIVTTNAIVLVALILHNTFIMSGTVK